MNKLKVSYEIIENLGEAFIQNSSVCKRGNILYFEPLLNSSSIEHPTLNLDSLWQANKSKSEALLPMNPAESNSENRHSHFYLAGLFLFFAGAIFWFWSKKRRLSDSVVIPKDLDVNQESLSDQYYRSIIACEKVVLSMEELDVLLGIDYMEADSRKLRRHRLLQDLKETHPGLITRIKDEKDRRRFLYQVKKGVKAF